MSVGLWEVGLRCCGCGVLLRVTRGASVVSEVCVCVFGVLLVCVLRHRAIFSFRYQHFSSSQGGGLHLHCLLCFLNFVLCFCNSLLLEGFESRVIESCNEISRLVFSRNKFKILCVCLWMQAVCMHRSGFSTSFFPALGCFVPLPGLFLQFMHRSLPFQALHG